MSIATADLDAPGAQARAMRAAVVPCAHCGLDVPATDGRASDALRFCCAGCKTAYAVIHDHGLDAYYGFSERRSAGVQPSGRAFAEFDHETFAALYVRPRADGLAEVELYLENVHCPSCVWLVERVSLTIPGVTSADLDIGRSRARIVWDRARTPLSAIATTLDALGYVPHPFRGVRAEVERRAEDRAALVRIGIAGAIAGNVMMIALAIYAGWFGGGEGEFEGYFRWWSLALTTPSLLGPGRVFFRSAWGALRRRTLHMDVPIALALGAAYAHGLYNTTRGEGPVYFDGVATLIFLLLVGRYLQQRAQRSALDSTELLHSLAPSVVRVVEGGRIREVPSEAALPGWILEVRAGDTLPADGVVESGETTLDLSLLTGESAPKRVRSGMSVYAGTVNVASPIRVRVTQAGEASRLGALLNAIAESSRRRSPVVKLADRMAGHFIVVVLVLAAAAFVVWAVRDPSRAVDNAIAMLVVTCPCALALATPLAVTGAIGRAARTGIFVRGGDALETLASSGTLVLDKTGTVTHGRMTLVHWVGSDRTLDLLGALEGTSRHPLGAAIVAVAGRPDAHKVTDVREVIGGGILGRVDGLQVVAGTERFVRAHSLVGEAPLPAPEAGCSAVYVAVDGRFAGVASVGDPVREDAAAAVAELARAGWRVELLSGDRQDAVTATARALGIDVREAHGGATPEAKREHVTRLAAAGRVVMVGDGVNDAPAMAAATASVGVHGGAEACLATADVFLSRPGLAPLVELVRGARRTMVLVRLGIGASIAYNVVGATLALAGIIDPLIAAIMMPASSLSVVLLAWRGPTFPLAAGTRR